ncbi:cornifelin-like [Protopterus annectens]|uniref:cornifelin-like n=1 Tax=Protopterus annectens TaxID=7888 RepID=UPI001CFBA615|nr:cornifelin-like [Protopterus annectens]
MEYEFLLQEPDHLTWCSVTFLHTCIKNTQSQARKIFRHHLTLLRKRSTMSSVAMQPQAITTQTIMVQENDWSSGICDCCDDMKICCCAFWCLPCFACSTADRFGECLCLPLLDYTSGHIPAVSLSIRVAARERYRIKGSICNDCCMICWCNWCSWCQVAREIKARKQQATIITTQVTSPIVTNYNPGLRAQLK